MPICDAAQADRLQPRQASEQTEALFTSLYRDLCRLARREVRRNGAHDVLSTGTLVHEAWLDISRRPALDFDEPGRFLNSRIRARISSCVTIGRPKIRSILLYSFSDTR